MGSTLAGRGRWGLGAGVALLALFGWFAFVRGSRVPLLGLVDLGFHELGHLLTYPLPDVVTASMGSVTQVAVPIGLAAYFFVVRGDRLGGSLCLGWAGASAADVSVYIADAPTEDLALLGEGEHDWAFVLGPEHLDALDLAAGLATLVKVLGFLLLFAGLAICCWQLMMPSPEASPQNAQARPWIDD
jgi:hypothetical protein